MNKWREYLSKDGRKFQQSLRTISKLQNIFMKIWVVARFLNKNFGNCSSWKIWPHLEKILSNYCCILDNVFKEVLICLFVGIVPQPGPPSKRVHRDPALLPVQPPAPEPTAVLPMNLLNGNRNRMGLIARTGRKQVMSWMDAPDDLYFRSTVATK